MKRKNRLAFGLILTVSVALTSCSDDFLQDKKNFDNASADSYDYFSGALGRVADVYMWCLPDVNSDPTWKYPSTGSSDDHSKSTEEYSGFGAFVNPDAELTYQSGNNPVPDYFQGGNGNIQTMVYGRIRNCNDVIEGIQRSKLSQEEKNQLLGQVYFFRAWCYYSLVKWYGGVPIIKEVQPIVAESVVPRSSTKACIDFICEDLNHSADLLAPYTQNGGWPSTDFGRVTSGTALALLGRVRLLWASPLFNRANDKTRWDQAYEDISRSIDILNACGHGLQYESAPGTNASGWAGMFAEVQGNKEAVFVTLYNTNTSSSAADFSKNNGWEQGIRPSNALGGGGKTPSAMMVDMFPMSDGKRPQSCNTYTTLEASEKTYDSSVPFLNRDPRFYRTFAFPGVRWTFNGNPQINGNRNPYNGNGYELWNYVWYTSTTDRDNVESGNTYGADNLLSNAKGIYVRKRSDDLDINATARYVYDNGFKYSASPYMEIRYAEVLLNYAEAACGAGHLDVAVEQLKKIRRRVGYSDVNNCGLQSNLTSDAAACMAAIIYERQIELAYEGKRFDDMRRWMLFDGGAESVDGAPATWKLTGWNGNTCTYLGFRPFNGQRRDNLEFRVKNDYSDGLGGDSWSTAADAKNPDPLNGIATRPAALNLKEELTEEKLAPLEEFYKTYLIRKKKKGDAFDSDKSEKYLKFYPKYYLLGLYQGAQTANNTLEQTIGWGDYMNGGSNGTFDPLAE